METLCFEKHLSCEKCTLGASTGFGFTCFELVKGKMIESKNRQVNHLLFVLSGDIVIKSIDLNEKIIHGGEMLFFSKSIDYAITVLEDGMMIILAHDNQIDFCEKIHLQAMLPYVKDLIYKQESFIIKSELLSYLNLLNIYLSKRISCMYLHEIKAKELFFIFKITYSIQECAQLFYPIIGKSMDFKSQVLKKYLLVKSVAELAYECGYSISVFRNRFIDEFGMPPYTWMQQQTSRRISVRLYQPDIPLKNIADEFHFSSLGHFIKFCKNNLGDTPAKIRKKFLLENDTSNK